MVFLIMNSIDILEELRMLMMIMTNFVERFHGDVIDRSMTSSQRNDEAKGYWNHRYDTNSKSSLLFEVKQ